MVFVLLKHERKPLTQPFAVEAVSKHTTAYLLFSMTERERREKKGDRYRQYEEYIWE
jgi:hypothetical protein